MVKLLVNRVKMGKMTLEEVKTKYPQYYEEVCKELGYED